MGGSSLLSSTATFRRFDCYLQLKNGWIAIPHLDRKENGRFQGLEAQVTPPAMVFPKHFIFSRKRFILIKEFIIFDLMLGSDIPQPL